MHQVLDYTLACFSHSLWWTNTSTMVSQIRCLHSAAFATAFSLMCCFSNMLAKSSCMAFCVVVATTQLPNTCNTVELLAPVEMGIKLKSCCCHLSCFTTSKSGYSFAQSSAFFLWCSTWLHTKTGPHRKVRPDYNDLLAASANVGPIRKPTTHHMYACHVIVHTRMQAEPVTKLLFF